LPEAHLANKAAVRAKVLLSMPAVATDRSMGGCAAPARVVT
jgi:hypothetical protein